MCSSAQDWRRLNEPLGQNRPPLQDRHAQARLGQDHCGGHPAGASADDDRVQVQLDGPLPRAHRLRGVQLLAQILLGAVIERLAHVVPPQVYEIPTAASTSGLSQ